MTKKISILLSVILIFAFMLTACNSKDTAGDAESATPSTVISSEEASSVEPSSTPESSEPTSSTEAPKEVTCEDCNGKKDCHECDENGKVTCTTCKGVAAECSKGCNNGYVNCQFCEGSGKCYNCNGFGDSNGAVCTACSGMGSCQSCSGKGKTDCPSCEVCATCKNEFKVNCPPARVPINAQPATARAQLQSKILKALSVLDKAFFLYFDISCGHTKIAARE